MRPPPEETGRLLASKIASKTPKIFTSDLKRAKRTAELYAAAMATTAGSSTPTEVEVEERLREPSLGKFEGMVKGREKTCVCCFCLFVGVAIGGRQGTRLNSVLEC